jgi:phage tail-like protein
MDMEAHTTSTKLSLAADFYNRYPGEVVTFYIQILVPESLDSVIQVSLPRVMPIESYYLPVELPQSTPMILEEPEEIIFAVPLKQYFLPGQTFEMSIKVRIKTFYLDQFLLVDAKLYENTNHLLASETIQIAVLGKGEYLQYLPEIYEDDEFMGRFLMLFESFWKPVTQQINQMDCYFDPDLTPSVFIPWLASWVGLPVDPSLPDDRVRSLLKFAMMFYQQRGTAHALKTYLEIYTNGKVSVVERRARNFVLGNESKLGVEIALGKDNRPYSILVNIHTSDLELTRMKYSKDMYLRKMMSLVRSMVPAHTIFDVNCEFIANT